MAATQRGELSAGIAVLGLLIEEPDTGAGISQRLSRRFPRAQFARSAVHNALPSLEARGLVRVLHPGSDHAFDRYCVTDEGATLFRAWMRDPSAASPALRDAIHARLAFAQLEDVQALIEVVGDAESTCTKEYAAAHARLLAHRGSDSVQGELQQRLSRLVRGDEATLWLTRLKRLQRLLAELEELRSEFARAPRRRAVKEAPGVTATRMEHNEAR